MRGAIGLLLVLSGCNHDSLGLPTDLAAPADTAWTPPDLAPLPLFGAPTDFEGPNSPVAIAGGDFNRDGAIDLVVTGDVDNAVDVLLGNGDGTFQPPLSLAGALFPFGIAVADLDGDGLLDLAVANQNDSVVSLFRGNGDGTFQGRVDVPSYPSQVRVLAADLDGDGVLDLAMAPCAGAVGVMKGLGGAAFGPEKCVPLDPNQPTHADNLTVVDLDGDGKLDLVATDVDLARVTVLRGNGDGTFAAPVQYPAGTRPVALATEDFDGDGKLDVMVANNILGGTGTLTLLRGRAGGTLGTPETLPLSSSANIANIVSGDWNGDGRLDVITLAGNDGGLWLLLGRGDGSFETPWLFHVSTLAEGLLAGDFNNDHRLDLATANYAVGKDVSVLLNQGP